MFTGYANAFDRNNAISAFLMGALPAVAGSTITFMLAAFAVWGIISLARGRFAFRLTRADRLMASTFTAFAVLILLTGLIAENGTGVFRSAVWLLPFLSLWFVIPRLRASPDIDYLRLYVLGAAAGCLGALFFAGAQIVLLGARAEGGAGNPAVFASMCLCLAGIAALGIDAPVRSNRLLAGIALVAGIVAVIISLTRGVALAIPPVLLVVLIYAPARWRSIALRPMTLVLFACAGLVLVGMWDILSHRVEWTFSEVDRLLRGDHTESIGERIRLWEAATAAVMDSPLLGHGIHNRMDALVPYLARDGLPIRNFTHPHNAFLAFAVDGGVVVLASLLALLAVPVLVAWRAPRDANHRKRLFLALVVTTAYVSFGMTQIMFKHDILDSFYIFTAMLVAATIPDREGTG